MRSGAGPYRRVSDAELRDIFYLTPQTGKSFMFSITTRPVPGVNHPAVIPLLRALLYIRTASVKDRAAFVKSAERILSDRQLIAIRAKIISLSRDVFEKPFAYPACLSTPENKTYWRELSKIADLSAIPSD